MAWQGVLRVTARIQNALLCGLYSRHDRVSYAPVAEYASQHDGSRSGGLRSICSCHLLHISSKVFRHTLHAASGAQVMQSSFFWSRIAASLLRREGFSQLSICFVIRTTRLADAIGVASSFSHPQRPKENIITHTRHDRQNRSSLSTPRDECCWILARRCTVCTMQDG